MKTHTTAAIAAAALVLLAGCQAAGSTRMAAPAPTTTTPSGSCHARLDSGLALPDPTCTPGATNPAVTQATIHQTICVTGWTATVRPPQSYTEPLKRSGIAAYGYTNRSLSAYEEDHLVPLEAGGAPSDPRNLWPEPGASPNLKDHVEGAARSAVCTGRMPLATVEAGFEQDWVTLGRQLGVKIP